MPTNERGFTMVELVVVVSIIGILLSAAIASYIGYRNRAFDLEAQATLRNTVLVETVHHTDVSVFTDSAADLEAIEPLLDVNVSGDPAGSVRVTIASASADVEVCLFSRSESGDWWAIYHSLGTGTFFGQAPPEACDAALAADWSSEGW